MKFWTASTDFLRTARLPILFALTLSLLILFSITMFYLGKLFAGSRESSYHFRPENGAVLFGSGVFCTLDGRNWQPAQDIGDGRFVCFLRSDEGTQQ